MKKQEFVNTVQTDYSITKEDATKVTEIVFAQIRKHLLAGREVRIDGVGSFNFKFRGPRKIKNNLTGERHEVGKTVKLKFKPFRSMERALRVFLLEDT